MKLLRLSAILLATVTLTACGMLEGGFLSNSCSAYNGSLDRFTISLEHIYWFTEPGQQFTAEYEATWLNDDLDRRSLNCKVDWKIADSSILEVSEQANTFNVIGQGFTTVEAQITGSGGTKHVMFEVASFPQPTETEPNNGTGSADSLNARSTHHGRIDYSNDVDYYSFSVPADGSFQLDLSDGVDLKAAENIRPSRLTGNVSMEGSNWRGDMHRTYTNDTGAEATYYVAISGSRNDQLTPRYTVTLHKVAP